MKHFSAGRNEVILDIPPNPFWVEIQLLQRELVHLNKIKSTVLFQVNQLNLTLLNLNHAIMAVQQAIDYLLRGAPNIPPLRVTWDRFSPKESKWNE